MNYNCTYNIVSYNILIELLLFFVQQCHRRFQTLWAVRTQSSEKERTCRWRVTWTVTRNQISNGNVTTVCRSTSTRPWTVRVYNNIIIITYYYFWISVFAYELLYYNYILCPLPRTLRCNILLSLLRRSIFKRHRRISVLKRVVIIICTRQWHP